MPDANAVRRQSTGEILAAVEAPSAPSEGIVLHVPPSRAAMTREGWATALVVLYLTPDEARALGRELLRVAGEERKDFVVVDDSFEQLTAEQLKVAAERVFGRATGCTRGEW